jgi:hypothetical protein
MSLKCSLKILRIVNFESFRLFVGMKLSHQIEILLHQFTSYKRFFDPAKTGNDPDSGQGEIPWGPVHGVKFKNY